MSKKICIDAGHYGKYNRSPVNKTYYESDAMWKLHLLQKKYLEELGFEVVLTRENLNTNRDLYERGAASKGCVLFISDHSNASGNENVDYVAVYHLTNDTTTKCDDISNEIAQKLAPVIAEVMGTTQDPKVLTRKAQSDRNRDGFLNDNYYGVLHGARCVNTPGLILEHSFHTNARSTEWLLNDDNLDKLAKAEAEAIADYFKTAEESAYTLKEFIKDVQSATGSKVDGIAGNETISKTITVSATKNRNHKVVKAIQKRLNALGYDCGEVDGVAGEKFTAAVEAFQKANGCVKDGEITARKKTWQKLLGML